MADRPEPRTHRNAAGIEFITVACDRCGFTHAHRVEAETAHGAVPRADDPNLDATGHCIWCKCRPPHRNGCPTGQSFGAAPRAEGPDHDTPLFDENGLPNSRRFSRAAPRAEGPDMERIERAIKAMKVPGSKGHIPTDDWISVGVILSILRGTHPCLSRPSEEEPRD